MESSYFESILDAIATAVCIFIPSYNDKNEIVDFKLEYQNREFKNITKELLKNGMSLVEEQHKLSPVTDWVKEFSSTLQNNKTFEKTFYSLVCCCYIKITITPNNNKYVLLSLIDVTQEKKEEQQLHRQNERLSALTEGLSVSRAGLQKKLDSVQTVNEQLLAATYHDPMTNLYNRVWLQHCLNKSIEVAKTDGSKIGFFLFDIDNLKFINDTSGHHLGDSAIRKCASILNKIPTKESDSYKNLTVFRIGSDEFVVLAESIETQDSFCQFANELVKTINAENLGISGGISFFPDDAQDATELMKCADLAGIEAKKNGKNQVFKFQKIMQEKFLQRMDIEKKLSKAAADKIFKLYYQPQFDVNTGELRGFEALLRWYDEELGWISPEKFIPLAEESRLVVSIGDWVIETAIETISMWEKEFNFNGVLSVNVSPLQFKEDSFIDKLKENLECHKIKAQHLEIEITEGILIDNFEEILSKLNKVKQMGIGISLDDFGTGYSSMRYLQLLPLTTLKIDKSFITNITEEGNKDTTLAQSIVSLVSNMGLNAIAEGVETDTQLQALKKFNYKNINVQGFLKGKPMPKNLCDKILAGDNSVILTIKDKTPEN